MERIFDKRTMYLVSVFQTTTSLFPKDCIENNNTVYFILPKDGKVSPEQKIALSKILGKKISFIKYYDNLEDFLKHMISPKVKVEKLNNNTVMLRLNKFNYLKYKKHKEVLDTIISRLYGIDKILVKTII